MHRPVRRPSGIVFALLLVAGPAAAQAGYFQTNLVSDIAGLARNTDPNLVNPWGISAAPGGPFWVSDQQTGVSTLYNTSGTPLSLVVTIPPAGVGGTGSPTGQVFNGTSDFLLNSGNPASKAVFIFASTSGTISGWNPNVPSAGSTTAVTEVTNPGAIYTGLAIGNNGVANYLYAANARGGIDVYDKNFNAFTLPGNFKDPNGTGVYTPYNIQDLKGDLYVTYANRSTGGGVVDEFDLNGNFIRRIASNGPGGVVDHPWGLVIAPASFGQFGGDLLVGNFGDGRISAFDPTAGTFLGQLTVGSGQFFSEPGLWGLIIGNGGAGGDADTLYFTAGIDGEAHGLLGSISAVPEPSSLLLCGVGGSLLLGLVRRKRRPAEKPGR